MQFSTRFTIAIHILTCIHTFQDSRKITSELLATSVNVNPVIIRKITSQLKKYGLISVQRGTGGATLAKKAEDISFLDIYRAVDAVDHNHLFGFHENPNPNCPVGRNIHKALDSKLDSIEKSLENALSSYTLSDVIKDI